MSDAVIRDKVPATTKLAWSCGAFADQFMTNGLSSLAFPIYNVALGVDPKFLGLALGIPRLWDAITDPIMGNISDNTRGRWGRRRPYVFSGAIMSGILFAMIWMPPRWWSPSALGWYFFAVAMVYYLVYTIFAVPWGAMGLEFSTDPAERTRIQAWKMVVASLGGLLMAPLWKLSFTWGMHDGVADEVVGVRYVAILAGILIMLFGVIPAIFCRESTEVQAQPKINFFEAFRETFARRDFTTLVAMYLCILVGIFMVNSFSMYINIHYVFGGDKEAASSLTMYSTIVYQGTGLAFTPVVAMVAARLGKRRTLMIGLTMVTLAYAGSWILFTPKAPFLQLISLALASPGLASAWILGSSMIADLCDADEYITGLRREGMYGAAYGWVIKTGISGTLILGGYMLDWSGFDSTVDAIQTPDTILNMRLLYAFVPVIFLVVAFLLLLSYPLTEERVQEIRIELDARKARRQV